MRNIHSSKFYHTLATLFSLSHRLSIQQTSSRNSLLSHISLACFISHLNSISNRSCYLLQLNWKDQQANSHTHTLAYMMHDNPLNAPLIKIRIAR